MTAHDKPVADHKNIATALAAAQAEMGRALKNAANPHFKSRYADLASVTEACLPALNRHGIAVIQPTVDDETGRYVKTVLIHGPSGETLECRVPLIVQKNDMQGYGSAVTYARRYGLMSMAGIAPEDDDGNAAAAAAPRAVTPEQVKALRDMIAKANADMGKFLTAYGVQELAAFPADRFGDAMTKLKRKADQIAAKAAPKPEPEPEPAPAEEEI